MLVLNDDDDLMYTCRHQQADMGLSDEVGFVLFHVVLRQGPEFIRDRTSVPLLCTSTQYMYGTVSFCVCANNDGFVFMLFL